MNTLRDTDEGRTRPSVWPVYVAAGVIGLMTLSRIVLPALAVDWDSFYLDPYLLVLLSIWLLFGMLTCWGLIRLRMWAWLCAALWTAVYAYWDMVALLAAQSLWREVELVSPPPPPANIGPFTVPAAVAIAVIAWALATRWQLFFPPKPESEE